jgi:hypothetical protein
MLCHDWIIARADNRSLTKEQFARARCGVTDEDLDGELSLECRAQVDVVLQELKPARLKRLDRMNRWGLESFIPLVIKPTALGREWQQAKRLAPALTKEDFLEKYFGVPSNVISRFPWAEGLKCYLEKFPPHPRRHQSTNECR